LIKLQQYNVFKINTSRLKELDYKLNDYSVSDARLNGELVQIGDNQVFRTIRSINGYAPDLERLEGLKLRRADIQTDGNDEEQLLVVQKEIDGILHVPEIVNVHADDKQVYKEISKNGFIVNGIEYGRLSSGAGQSRRNIASFVDVRIKEELEKKLNCGLKVKKINVAKYNAYFGLYMSATYPVDTPRVCLIDDYEEAVLPKRVDWIKDVEGVDVNGKKTFKRVIEEDKDFDFVPNMWDGQGLISPTFAAKWQENLELDYLPSQFGIRSSFIKGMLVTFDFHKYAKEEAKTEKIIDYYGEEWNINDIDVLLSVSQFKMYKYYSSWEEFVQLQEHHGLSWGVTKVNPKFDKEMSLTNYQYLQCLNLDKGKLEELMKPTVDWIEKICSGDKLYTLLFLMGAGNKNETIADIFDKTNNDIVQAVLYNEDLLKDPYIRRKIYDSISSKIDAAKIGRLWVNGNYQAMVSDPYGQAQFAFKQPVTGLLEEFNHYSTFWLDREITQVDACRSPMVDFHEHNVLDLVQTDEMEKWYKYIKSGIIYNVWGVDTIRHSDSDWDYDIVFTTDNQVMLDNIVPDKNVITYDKSSAPSQTLTPSNILKTDLRSFDSKVGAITNYSTTFISMLANFKPGSREHDELLDRIKLLRRYIGDSIDQAKGIKMKPFPSSWKKRMYLYDEDTKEERKEKYYHNSLVASKKPYFMIYIYDKIMNEYKEYKKKGNRTCREKFGMTLNDLLGKQDKTKEEKSFIREFYFKMPVLKNKAPMNVLCSMIEAIDFKYKRPNPLEHVQETYGILRNKDIVIDEDKIQKLVEIRKRYNKGRNFKVKNQTLSATESNSEQEVDQNSLLNEFYDQIRLEAATICPNQIELSNHLVHIDYILYPKEPKDFSWNLGLDGIMETLRQQSNGQVEIPMHDKNGTVYLGKRYSLRSVVV
jgi:hypothetical protein